MYEVFLNAVRLAVSEDARKSVSALLEFVRRSPEWQQDICTLQARVSRCFAEQGFLLGGLTASKMENLQYPKEVIEAFKISYSELLMNAFEHGCRSGRKTTIGIEIAVTSEYVALTMLNSKGVKFNLDDTIELYRTVISLNPDSRRGRGLMLVAKLADTFESTPNREGVKAVFYKDRVSFQVDQVDGVIILELVTGLFNPSVSRRLFDTAVNFLQNDLILDFRRWTTVGTKIVTKALELGDLYARAGRKIVALLFRADPQEYPHREPPVSAVEVPTGVVAHSWEEALNKIGRPDLLEKVRQLKSLRQ